MRESTVNIEIGKGLRNSYKSPRNSGFLVESVGAIPEAKVIHAVETVQTLDLSSLNCVFPFPQLFMCREFDFICTQTAIYRLVGTNMTLLLSGITPGLTWSVADFATFVLFTNGKVIIQLNPETFELEVINDEDLPPAICIVNINGQAMFGSPTASTTFIK